MKPRTASFEADASAILGRIAACQTTGRCWLIDGNAILVAIMIIRHDNNQTEIDSPAKVNLFLELLGKRPDGFHEIETVMSTVSIYDRLRFTRRSDSKIRMTLSTAISTDNPTSWSSEQDEIPTDERNLIHRALTLIRKTARQSPPPSDSCQSHSTHRPCETGIDVQVLKSIPSAAGLGGASSNAAAALVAGNLVWNLGWSKQQLVRLAEQLGSDIPFFLTGGTAVCRGRGEIIHSLPAPSGLALVIAKASDSLSTAEVFSHVSPTPQRLDCESMLQSVLHGRPYLIGNCLFNRLQQFASPLTEQISNLRREFQRLNCWGHQMSGSGSSYFGVFPNTRVARQAANRLSARLPHVRIFCSQTPAAFDIDSLMLNG